MPAASASSGAVRFNEPDELDQALTWLDDNTDGKPYGVDVVMPMKIPTEGKSVDLKAMIPEEHITLRASARCSSSAYPRSRRARAAKACWAGCTRWPAPTSTSR